MHRASNRWRFCRSGLISGAGASLAFLVIHDILISDIWFSVAPMLAAGALCGACIGWTYGLLVRDPSVRGWIAYNLLYITLLFALGVVSVGLYDPITTMADVLQANAAPTELIVEALPMTILFILVAAAIVGRIYARRLVDYGAILVTCTVLIVLLGLNVSTIGLVFIPSGSFYLIVEMFGLIFALGAGHAVVFILLERGRLLQWRSPVPHAAGGAETGT